MHPSREHGFMLRWVDGRHLLAGNSRTNNVSLVVSDPDFHDLNFCLPLVV